MAYIQSNFGTEGASPSTCVLAGVLAGSTLIAFVLADASGAPTGASSSIDGAFTATGSVVGPTNGVSLQRYVKQNCSAGSHTISGTSGADAQVIAIECSGPSSGTLNTNQNSQAAPGSGTDAITSNSVTISSSSMLAAVSCDVTNTGATFEPVVGTGFVQRQHSNNADMGSWVLETIQVSASQAATATHGSGDAGGANSYITSAIEVPDPTSAGGFPPMRFEGLPFWQLRTW